MWSELTALTKMLGRAAMLAGERWPSLTFPPPLFLTLICQYPVISASYPHVSLSLDENVRAKDGGKETTGETALRLPSVPFPWSLAVHHQSLASATLRKTKRQRRKLLLFHVHASCQTHWLSMDNEHWTCYSKNINHLYFTFNEKDVFIILHCLGEPFDVTLSVFVRLGASMTKAFWTKQGTVAWHIAVRFAIFLQRAAHKLPIFSTSGTRAEKVDCERSLFSSSDLVRGVPRARALSDEAARGEKRGRLPVSRLAPSVTRVVIYASRAFCSTDQQKRETARSLPKKRLLKTTFCHSSIRFVV